MMWHDADRNRLFFPQELRTHIAVALKMSNIGRCRPVVRDGARRKELRSSEKRRTDCVPLSRSNLLRLARHGRIPSRFQVRRQHQLSVPPLPPPIFPPFSQGAV